MSSCEWCSSWNRQSMRARWFARCTAQLQPSMATTISAIAAQRGTRPIRGRTIHGRDVWATCTVARVSPVTRGTTSVAFTSVKSRSWRYPRANIGRGCAGQVRSTTRNTPMISRVAGPATTARRLTTEPAKSAPPQPLAQPTPSSIPAATAITQAGTYTRDESANLSRRATRSPRSTTPSVGARVGSTTPVVTTSVPSRLEPLERHAPGAGVRGRRALGRGGLHRHHVPGAAEGVDAIALGLLGLRVEGEAVER